VVFVSLQELEGSRAACVEGDALLQEAEGRVAAAQAAAVSAQEQAVQVRTSSHHAFHSWDHAVN
jgi:hypothetical protein